MIRINLLPLKETQRALGQRQQVSVALLSLSVALLIMVVPFVLQGRTLARLDGRVQELEKEITQLEAQTKEARDLESKKRELQAKLKVIDDLNRKRMGPTQVLDGLSTAAPEKLWLVEFAEIKGAATMTGMALDNQTVATFMRQLSQSAYFTNVDLVEATQSEPARAGETSGVGRLKRFIVKAGIDYFGRADGGSTPANAAPGATP